VRVSVEGSDAGVLALSGVAVKGAGCRRGVDFLEMRGGLRLPGRKWREPGGLRRQVCRRGGWGGGDVL